MMDYEFNNEYLAKFFISLVRDEGNRIMSLGLADKADLSKLVESSLNLALKQGNDNTKILLETLSILHNKLSSVKLPGDFKKIACGSDIEELLNALNITDGAVIEIEIKDDTSPVKEMFKVTENIKPEDDGAKKKDEEEEDEEVKHIVAELEKMSYKLGKQGNHMAAYAIDRTINELSLFLKK